METVFWCRKVLHHHMIALTPPEETSLQIINGGMYVLNLLPCRIMPNAGLLLYDVLPCSVQVGGV